jgi:hypothetical protein
MVALDLISLLARKWVQERIFQISLFLPLASCLQTSGFTRSGKQSLENHITGFAEAEASVAFPRSFVFPLHVKANAAAVYIRFPKLLDVRE